MRRLAITILVALGRTADARIVISEPPIVEACRGGKTWAELTTCLTRQGAVTIERVLPKAKLVRIVQTEDKRTYDAGIYLYLQRADGSWSVGGMFTGTSYTVLELVPYTIENHAGFRLRVGQLVRTTVSLDGVTSMPVIIQTQRTLFCGGDSYGCADVTTHCDVIYRGKTMWTFRGALAFRKGMVLDAGDRSRGGLMCVPGEVVFLGWPTGAETTKP